ncbi:MAG: AMIN domain-containing protein, partial [Betaproteobacteria bacterium]
MTVERLPVPDPIRRGLLVLPLLLSPLMSRDASAAPTRVSSARVWPANEYTRVTFESPVALKYQHFFVKSPERLVIDIENIDIGPALKELAAKIGTGDPYIQSVRVAVNRANVIRVVLDLKTEVKPQVFAVPPAGEFGHRLMLDIYPARPADPMLALLNEDVAAFGKGTFTPPAEALPANGADPVASRPQQDGRVISPDNKTKPADSSPATEPRTTVAGESRANAPAVEKIPAANNNQSAAVVTSRKSP